MREKKINNSIETELNETTAEEKCEKEEVEYDTEINKHKNNHTEGNGDWIYIFQRENHHLKLGEGNTGETGKRQLDF